MRRHSTPGHGRTGRASEAPTAKHHPLVVVALCIALAGADATAGDPNSRGGWVGSMGNNLPAIDLGTGRSAAQVAGGSFHVCAAPDDCDVKRWGNNGFGHIGLGDSTNRGDGIDPMGEALPFVDLGNDRFGPPLVVSDIAALAYHGCAQLAGGRGYVAGNTAVYVSPDTPSSHAVLGLTADGSPDTCYSGDGAATHGVGSHTNTPYAVGIARIQ